jgi:putative ABC transport system permease protein
MDTLRQDISYAIRSLRRSSRFTAAVVLTLTIGIGALTAVFSVVNAVLLEPLPFRSPSRIVQIWSGPAERTHGPTSPANFLDLRAEARSFEAISAEDFSWFNLASDGAAQAERLFAAHVSPSFFSAVGVDPAIGRGFVEADEQPSPRIVVLSHGVWQRRFGGDARIVGRSLRMNGEHYEIVGVMPRGFDFPGPLISQRIDLWVPLGWAPGQASRGMREVGITARLRDGVSLGQAQAEVDGIAARLAAAYPQENAETSIRLMELQEEIVGSSRRVLSVLFGAVAFVLLVACANVANLSLARAQRREREVNIRSALGARPGRIARQFLTESMVLALVGGSLGVVFATWLTDALVTLAPAGLPRVSEIEVDARVLGFAGAASILTSLVFGIVPALTARRSQLVASLRANGRAMTGGREHRRLRGGLVVLEMSTALVLLVGAGLLLKSLERLTSVDPGFATAGVVAAQVTLQPPAYATEERQRQYITDALERVRGTVGVGRAAAIDYLPFSRGDISLGVTVEGRPVAGPADEASAHLRRVDTDYFGTLEIPLITGRTFEDADRGGPFVAVVNEAMARRYWPSLDPIAVVGRRVRLGTSTPESEWHTIVGVVGNVKHWSLRDDVSEQLYVPLARSAVSQFSIVVRGSGSTRALAAATRQALMSVDRDQPVNVRPLEELVTESFSLSRFQSLLLGSFATIALVLAVIGIYGVISYSVSQRSRELGIRLALGARRGDIVRMVLGEGLVLTVIGLAVGVAASFWLTGFVKQLLFDVSPTDPAIFVVVSLLLAATATIANYVPARAAASVDPMGVMQAE